ncbi:MAG: ABC transporter ATP-binding protein, partial [Candidatus Zixiibacteriota bacterium]
MNEQSGGPMIEASGLSKYYGPFVAIEDISFSIPRGQVVAFLGPNGAGKSTTMKILSGFLAASKGSASIGGHDITGERLQAARKLGYLPENGPLYENMTPRELLEFFAEARGMSEKLSRGRREAVIEQCSLGDVLDKPISKLSRGYRQRVGLAQALLHDPEALIMD